MLTFHQSGNDREGLKRRTNCSKRSNYAICQSDDYSTFFSYFHFNIAIFMKSGFKNGNKYSLYARSLITTANSLLKNL